MAVSPFRTPIREPESVGGPLPEALDVEVEGADELQSVRDGNAVVTELPDGGAIVDFSPKKGETKPNKFDANLADQIDEAELNRISSELLEGIRNDDSSRQVWLATHAEGIKLLGLTIEEASSGVDSTSFEGISKARHPLLLEACLLLQANARGELLPAAGPVKVRDDESPKHGIGHNGGPPLDMAPVQPPPVAPPIDRSNLADALQKDFNHYLTTTAQEYYPDTDQMLFRVGFGGVGVKKVYNCPIRRRPVSESVDIEDFIVSNALTDLSNAGRVTQRVKMRRATLRRMQLLNVYRDIEIGEPTGTNQANEVDEAKAAVVGVQVQPQDPKDNDYELYECYCELELDDFAPPQFKGKGLALPYRVTIEKESEKVLEIRRNWSEKDEQCLAKEFFVEFPYVKAFGFYGIGLLHILGNTTKTLTAAWRELIDSGMFANFPGFIYAKPAGRQLTNQFRVPPGGGVGLDVGLSSLRDAVMPLPYKDLGPGFTAFVQHVEESGKSLGGTSNINIGEGRQDAPVGTTLALIEQATKPVGAVIKRLYSAQSKELQLLKERFRDDPEAFWRFNKKPAMPWQKEQFIKALDDFDLVPVSDPNNPTGMHRAAKASALHQIALSAPGLLDPRKVWKRIAQAMDIDDPDDLLAAPQEAQAPQADPAKIAELELKGVLEEKKLQAKMLELAMKHKDAEAERESKERLALLNIQEERLRLASTLAIHADRAEQASAKLASSMQVGRTRTI